MSENKFWDPFEQVIDKDSVSVERLKKQVVHSPVLDKFARFILPLVKPFAARSASAIQIAEKLNWGVRLIAYGQKADMIYSLLNVRNNQAAHFLYNEFWGTILLDNAPISFYSTEVILKNKSLQNNRVFFFNLPNGVKTDFELIPENQILRILKPDMNFESNEFNKLFYIKIAGKTMPLETYQLINPAVMSVLINWVNELGPFKFLYNNGLIVIFPIKKWPTPSLVSYKMNGQTEYTITDSDKYLIEQYLNNHLQFASKLIDALQ